MTTLDPDAPTRREVDQIAGWLTRLEQRVEAMDQLGTRGMGALMVQITEVAKDVGELGAEQRLAEQGHREQHDHEQAQRVTGRRWLITLALGNAVALLGPWLVVLHH